MPAQQPKKIDSSWTLTKAAWGALRSVTSIHRLASIGLACLVFAFSLWIIIMIMNPSDVLYTSSSIKTPDGFAAELSFTSLTWVSILVTFALLGIASTFITGAIVHAAIQSFKGKKTSATASLAAVWRRGLPLAVFALVNIGVGQLISYINNRMSPTGGLVLSMLGDAAWGVATFFAIPVIMTEDTPQWPIQTTKKSLNIMKKVWGESLISGVTIGAIGVFIAVLYGVVSSIILFALISIGNTAVTLSAAGLLGVGLAAIIVITSTLSAILKAALYYYATTGLSPINFNKTMLHAAFTPKKAERIFSV